MFISGKTKLKPPRWTESMGGKIPLRRDSPMMRGDMTDLLKAQHAELTDSIRREESKRIDQERAARNARSWSAWKVREHDRDLEALAGEARVIHAALKAEVRGDEGRLVEQGVKLRISEGKVAQGKVKLVAANKTIKSQRADNSNLEKSVTSLKAVVAKAERDRQAEAAELERAQQELKAVDAELEKSVTRRAELVSTIHRLAGKGGGRPTVNRSDREVEVSTLQTQLNSRFAMKGRLVECIGQYGEEGSMATTAVMAALEKCGYLKAVFESQQLWALRMAWLEEQRELLQISWDPDLTFRLKDQLNLSFDKVDQLRSLPSLTIELVSDSSHALGLSTHGQVTA